MPKTHIITFKGVETDEELRRAHLLMTSQDPAPYTPSIHWLNHHAERYPQYFREHTRIACVNGDVVAALRITTDTMRIGEARLKVGGIGWIAHKSDSTIIHSLVEETTRYLQEHRYHISVIFAPIHAYTENGYAQSLNDNTIKLPLDKIRHPPIPNQCIRAMKPGDISAILQIYTDKYRHVPCSILREYTHMSIKWDVLKQATVLTSLKGVVEGYWLSSVKGDEVHIYEIAMQHDVQYSSVLAYCKTLAHDHLTTRLVLHIPHEHPLTQYLHNSSLPIEYAHATSPNKGLVRIIDLEETLESMIPEWEHRIHKSLLRERHCEVTMMVEGTPYRIRIHYGVLDIAKQVGKNKFTVSRQTFTHLLTGFDHFGEIWSQDRRLINREGKALLEVLFPKLNPYITPFDHY